MKDSMIAEDITHNWISHILPDFKASIFTLESIHSHCIAQTSPLKFYREQSFVMLSSSVCELTEIIALEKVQSFLIILAFYETLKLVTLSDDLLSE